MAENSCTDLSFATTDELIEEVFRRCHGAVIVTEIEVRGDSTMLQPDFRWTGGITMAMGLLQYCDRYLEKRVKEMMDCDEDDEE